MELQMDRQSIPGWYFPTNVVFVDDNRKFLNSLKLILNPLSMTPYLIDDPLSALKYIESKNPSDHFMQRCLSKSQTEPTGFHSIDLNINAIHEEIYNPKRFEEISTIVVDYAMPSLNGLEFCNKVRYHYPDLKILMLTGEADEKFAVEAFNEGSIDKFIRKDTNNFKENLNECILSLQKNYALELSQMLLKGVDDSLNPFNQIARDSFYIKLFNELIHKYNIAEYYLLDLDGSFIMLDFNGKPTLLMVRNEESMEDAYQIAFHSDENFPESTLASMRNREKILCLYETEICDNPAEANKFLYPAQKSQGDKLFYYAVIEEVSNFDIRTDEIFSYQAYLNSIKDN